MKKISLPFCLIICISFVPDVNAQQEKYIDSLKVIPLYPNATDIVKAVCFSHYQYAGCELDSATVEVDTNKRYIHVDAGHYLENRNHKEECYSIDTVPIGLLAIGHYTLDYTITTLDFPEYTDYKTILFDVVKATRIINKLESPQSIRIYPNPATNMVTIDLSQQTEANVTILITDLTGRSILLNQLDKTTSKSIDIKELPMGVYFVNIYSGNHRLTSQKLIILNSSE